MAGVLQSLKDQPADVGKTPKTILGRNNWPLTPRDELTSALDGNWAEVEKVVGTKLAAKAQTKGAELTAADIIRRRAIRCVPDADPGLPHARPFPRQARSARDRAGARREELDPRSYSFTEADYDRKIFLDHVLGLEYATLREIVALCERTTARRSASSSCTSRMARRRPGFRSASRSGQGDQFHPRGPARDPDQAGRGEGFEKFCDLKFTGTKRFGLDGAESLIPALNRSSSVAAISA